MSKAKETYNPPNWDIPFLNPKKPVEGITKDEAYSIAEFIDMNLFRSIQTDEETDSIQWLRNMIHGYEKLCAAGGYQGLTEEQG